jgi:hypothetical protein
MKPTEKRQTLGEFITEDMEKRNMNPNEYARWLGYSHTVVHRMMLHGISETYGVREVGNPSLEFLYTLAKKTHTDLGKIAALVYPDAVFTDPFADLIASMIAKLPDTQRQFAETFLRGLLSQKDQESA